MHCGLAGAADAYTKTGFQDFEHGFGFADFELAADADIGDFCVDNLNIKFGVAINFVDHFAEWLAGK